MQQTAINAAGLTKRLAREGATDAGDIDGRSECEVSAAMRQGSRCGVRSLAADQGAGLGAGAAGSSTLMTGTSVTGTGLSPESRSCSTGGTTK